VIFSLALPFVFLIYLVEIMSIIIGLLVLGLGAGLIAGMFGKGGGIIIVPALSIIFGFSIIQSNATSLAALMLPVGIFGVMSYYKKGLVDIKIAMIFALGIFLASSLGAKIAMWFPPYILKLVYGAFLLWVAAKQIGWLDRNKKSKSDEGEKKLKLIYLLIIGGVTGVVSGMFGIGGGLIMVPVMTGLLGFEQRKAAATSLTALLPPSSFPAVLAYYYAGELNIPFAAYIAVGLSLGSIYGAKINLAFSPATAKKVYGYFLLTIAVSFIIWGFLPN
jgi:uncharacterized membrane protein YfcA